MSRRIAAEFVGTAFLVAAVVGSGIMGERLSNGNVAIALLTNPTALAKLQPGETVLDLGSGGGIDVLLSARRVGPAGKAFGLDMTDEMLALAEENKRKSGLTNVEFLKGEIEDIPLPDNTVDVIVSNCVINLSGDKHRVLREAFRVLKPGGRLAVGDLVVATALATGSTAPSISGGSVTTWTQIGTTANRGDGNYVSMFSGIVTSAAASTVTFSGVTMVAARAIEFSGNSATPLDAHSQVASQTGASIGVPVVTNQTADLILEYAFDSAGPSSFTPPTGWTTLGYGASGPSQTSANNWFIYTVAGAPGTYQPTLTFPGFVGHAVIGASFLAGTQNLTLTLPAQPPSTKWFIQVDCIGPGTTTINPNGLQIDGSVNELTITGGQGLYIGTDGFNYFSVRGDQVSAVNGITGAVEILAGTGISVTTAAPDVTIANTGVTSAAGAASVVVSPSTGAITVTGPTFETNGTNNSSQTTLNLVAGSNITLTNTSGGNVSIAGAAGASIGGANVKTANYTAVSGDNGKLLYFGNGNAYSFVQGANTGATGGTSVTLGSNTTSGNMVIASSLSQSSTAPTPSGGGVGTWTEIGTAQNRGDGWYLTAFYGTVTGTPSNTISFTGQSGSTPATFALEFSGEPGTSILDQSAQGATTGANPTAAVTATQAGDLVIGWFVSESGPGSFTNITNYSSQPASGNANQWIVYRTSGVSGTNNPGLTFASSMYGFIAATFNPQSASGLSLTLPATPPNATWNIFVQNGQSSAALTINPNGKTLDGSASNLCVAAGKGLFITTDGTNYYSMRGGA